VRGPKLHSVHFSIIIPTYNEAADIRATLEALVALKSSAKEIIVVDDSTDATPAIVAEYSDRGVKLVKPEVRRGRCEARNIGVRAASGDVLVILNADVRLPVNFLDLIAPLYEQGYDSVAVHNTVANQENVYARFIEAKRNRRIANRVYQAWAARFNGVFWTEAFSVRKDVAMKTRLFPSGYDVPIEAGEDARFAEDLRKVGCRGFFAEYIVVPHIAPDTLREFWRVRKGRGAGTPQIRFFLDEWPLWKISGWRYMKLLQRLFKMVAVAPLLLEAFQYARHMHRPLIPETLRYAWVIAVEEMAKTLGEYESHRRIRHGMAHRRREAAA